MVAIALSRNPQMVGLENENVLFIKPDEVFLYPSLCESFGIPMLEAMACGVPVITSNTSSMPGVSGDAAILIDLFKPGKITVVMNCLVTDSELRSMLVSKGLNHTKQFAWRKMAEQVLALCKNVMNNSNKKSND